METNQLDPEPTPPAQDGIRLGQVDPERFPSLHAALSSDSTGALNAELGELLGERRRATRHHVELLARLDHPDCHIPARVVDLSETGVRVRLLRRKPLDLMLCGRMRLRCLAAADEPSDAPHLDVEVGLVRIGRMDDEAIELGFRFL